MSLWPTSGLKPIRREPSPDPIAILDVIQPSVHHPQVDAIPITSAIVTAIAIQNFRFARFSASMHHSNGSRRHRARVSQRAGFGSEGEGAGGSPSRFREPSTTDHAAAPHSGHGAFAARPDRE